ncbi:MAG: R3H domain-containing nucleic acid-binding protein [Patescibacteria group bacterium]
MLNQEDIENIKKITKEFFEKMTFLTCDVRVDLICDDKSIFEKKEENKTIPNAVELNIKTEEPQILIGEKGQTLFEIQRLLKIILNKKLQKIFYLNFDINDYKKKKIEYLKDIANDLANEVCLIKEERYLFPMPAYERRVIHTELIKRQDVLTESQGDGENRRVVIKPR